MKIILQRVSSASVTVGGRMVGQIDQGLMLLVGFGRGDEQANTHAMQKAANKIANLRVFSNAEGKLDHSLTDIAGELLLVPQFTLLGKAEKGRRPDFVDAMAPEQASPAFDRFCDMLEAIIGRAVARGEFGADMQVSLVNDGPFTLVLEF